MLEITSTHLDPREWNTSYDKKCHELSLMGPFFATDRHENHDSVLAMEVDCDVASAGVSYLLDLVPI